MRAARGFRPLSLRRFLPLLLLTAVPACDTLPGPEAITAEGDIAILAAGAGAAVRTSWPSPEDPGPPFYVRLEPSASPVPMDNGWAALVFYRDPDCIPADFNLLEFFDAPAAFACPVVMSGSSVWAVAPFVGSPRVATQQGNAVPVWFLPADAMLAALADGHITIGKIAAIPGRMEGVASKFNEVLHPHPLPPHLGGGGHPNPGIVINAQGRLADGRSFQLLINGGDVGRSNVRINFR